MKFSGAVAFTLLSLLACSRAEDQITPDQIDNIVKAHNTYRAAVVPPASNMKPMSWDDNLAAKAQSYAEKCIWGHNTDRTSPLGKVGENLYITTGKPTDYSAAVTSWNNENAYYEYSLNSCQKGKMCGHYTQVVWANSYKVGCGIKRCTTLEGSSSKNALLIVCNYYPPGNYVGQRPYEAVTKQEELNSSDMWNEIDATREGEEPERFNNQEEEMVVTGEKPETEEIVSQLRNRLRGLKHRHRWN